MTNRRKAILLALFILAGLLASPFAFRAAAEPWCEGSSAGYCNPIADPAPHIPPDMPPRVPPSAGMKTPDYSELGRWQRPIPSVRVTTLRLGWPRFPTDAEQSAILDRVIGIESARFRKTDKRPASGWATCHFGPDGFTGIYCGMFIKPMGGKAKRYRVDVTVWPGGMYRVTRASNGVG